MNGAIYSKLEIDVMQSTELLEASQIAHKYKLPAIVVHPGLASDAIVIKGKMRGLYKLITPVDWPKGDVFGTTKFRGLTTDALEADGFEFMIQASRSESDIAKEIKSLTDFVRQHLSQVAEIRFVLTGIKTDEDLTKVGKAILQNPMPSFVRNDISLKTQVSKANSSTHESFINTLKGKVAVPIKLSGNINSIRSTIGLNASRFAVNLAQAKAIIKEFVAQPKQVIEMLEQNELPRM